MRFVIKEKEMNEIYRIIYINLISSCLTNFVLQNEIKCVLEYSIYFGRLLHSQNL